MNDIRSNNNKYPQRKRIKFCFSDKSSIEYDYNLIYSINPKIIIAKSKMDEEGKYLINLPEKIRKEDLVEFLFLYIGNNKQDTNNYFTNSRNKYISIINQDKRKFESFLEILIFFNNDSFNAFLINNLFIPEMKKEKIIDFFLFSYKIINLNKDSEYKKNNSYLNLFNLCFEKICKTEKYLIKYYNKLKILDKDILRKIIEKIFFNLLKINCLLNTDQDSDDSINLDGYEENDNNSNNEKKSLVINNDIPNKIDDVGEEYVSIDYNNINDSYSSMKKDKNYIIRFEDFRKLINILMDISNQYNIYDLLIKEYLNILSGDSINELNINNRKKYIFQKKLFFNSIKNNNIFYEECPLEIVINNKTIYLIIFYQPLEKSINVCIKLKDNKINNDKLFQHLNDNDYCFKLFTFYTSVQISKGHNIFNSRKHNCIISLTNNKSMYNIFKSSINIEEFNNSLNYSLKEGYFTIKAEIKLCYIYTGLISYLLQDFSTYSNDSHISKLSKQLFILILSNKYLDKKNENDIVNSILLWLNDEINIKEDISEIFYNINWENVDDALIFELIVKYSHYISNNESTQLIFYKIFEEKYGELSLIKKLINNIFLASKKINYEKIFSKMKNNDKFNNAYISYNSYLNISNKNFKHIKTIQNKQLSSFDNILKKNNSLSNKIINTNFKQKTDNLNNYNNKNNNKIKFTKIKKNININRSRSTLSIKKGKEGNNSEKMQRKIHIKKSEPKIIKNGINNTNYYKKLKPSLTKNNTHDFMKLTINSNSTLYTFQNLFNKTFNSFNDNNNKFGGKEKKERNYSKNNSISTIKKKSYKIKIGNK